MKRRDLAALVLIAAIWGGSYILIRIIVPAVGPWGMVGGRMIISAVASYAMLRVAGLAWGDKQLMRHYIVTAFFASFLAQFLIASAAQTLNAATLAILNATASMFSALMLFLFFGEPLVARRAGGMLLGMAGVAMVVGYTPLPFTWAVVLAFAGALGAAACYAYSSIHATRNLGNRPALELAFTQSFFAGLLALPFAWPALTLPLTQPDWVLYWTPKVLIALAALAIVCTAFANWLFYGLMKRTGPTATLSVTFLIPVFSLIWGWLFLGETIAPLQLAGFGVIVAALLLVASRR